VPDAVSSLRPSPALLGALAAAVVALWLGWAVAAGVTQSDPLRATGEAPGTDAAPIGLELTPAPALRVRPLLLKHAADAIAPAPSAPTPARSDPTPSAPPPAASAPATPPATPEPVAPVTPSPAAPVQQAPAPVQQAPAPAPQPAPKTRRAPKPQPTLIAQPKRSSSPDFDESAPSGFDTAG
jgi:outer membrane biosynthesis protein TonB